MENVVSHGFPRDYQEKTRINIIFYKEDTLRIKPHDDDPLVISVQQGNWNIKCVLIDPGSSADVLFWNAFQNVQLNADNIKTFNDSFKGLSTNMCK